MPSFDQNDDVDYKELRRQRSEDRESIREIERSLKIDEDDLFAKLATAAARATPDQRNKAFTRATIGGNGQISRTGSTLPYIPNMVVADQKYAEIADVLDRFKFSANEKRKGRQMKIIVTALRSALQDMILEEVAINTKIAFKGYAEKVTKCPGGLKVYFNFNENKFSVVAKGGFMGDETICVHDTNGKIKASVLRIDGEDFTDLSNSFEVIIEK